MVSFPAVAGVETVAEIGSFGLCRVLDSAESPVYGETIPIECAKRIEKYKPFLENVLRQNIKAPNHRKRVNSRHFLHHLIASPYGARPDGPHPASYPQLVHNLSHLILLTRPAC